MKTLGVLVVVEKFDLNQIINVMSVKSGCSSCLFWPQWEFLPSAQDSSGQAFGSGPNALSLKETKPTIRLKFFCQVCKIRGRKRPVCGDGISACVRRAGEVKKQQVGAGGGTGGDVWGGGIVGVELRRPLRLFPVWWLISGQISYNCHFKLFSWCSAAIEPRRQASLWRNSFLVPFKSLGHHVITSAI